jgi:hypothetical protein
MATMFAHPENLEAYIRMCAQNARDAADQIHAGQLPSYDANCRTCIEENCMQIVRARLEQLELDPDYTRKALMAGIDDVALETISWRDFPEDLTLRDMRLIARFIIIGGPL